MINFILNRLRHFFQRDSLLSILGSLHNEYFVSLLNPTTRLPRWIEIFFCFSEQAEIYLFALFGTFLSVICTHPQIVHNSRFGCGNIFAPQWMFYNRDYLFTSRRLLLCFVFQFIAPWSCSVFLASYEIYLNRAKTSSFVCWFVALLNVRRLPDCRICYGWRSLISAYS